MKGFEAIGNRTFPWKSSLENVRSLKTAKVVGLRFLVSQDKEVYHLEVFYKLP